MSLITPPTGAVPAPTVAAPKAPQVIVPSVGRVLWFWPSKEYKEQERAQPCAAICTYVHSERMVNISTYNCNGEQYPLTSVPLRQPDDADPAKGPFVEWMPYQIGQAAKA